MLLEADLGRYDEQITCFSGGYYLLSRRGMCAVQDHPTEAAPLTEKNSVVDPILAQQQTINPFLAWNVKAGRSGNKYGLAGFRASSIYTRLIAAYHFFLNAHVLHWEIAMKSIKYTIAALAVSVGFSGAAHSFSLDFNWEGLELCTSGRPNIVSNPEFIIDGLPEGTGAITFRLVDKDVPSFNHGGGTVVVTSNGVVAPGAFKYKSPCPPNGSHTYEWTATAKTKKGFGGRKLGVARAARQYP